MEPVLDFERLNQFIAEDRLIRRRWTGTDQQARETACLLAAMYPPAGAKESADACPAGLMRPWLAHLTVWIDDSGTADKWSGHIRRYAAVIPKVVALSADADDRLSREIRVIIIREALMHVTVDEWGVRAACDQTIAALESGDAAALKAAWSAAWSARSAAEAAWSADGSAWSAAGAAWSAAGSAWSAAGSAWSAAEDRMIDAMLAAMERAVA